MNILYTLIIIAVVVVGIFNQSYLYYILAILLIVLIYQIYSNFTTKDIKELKKIQKRKLKKQKLEQKLIKEQLEFIEKNWGYTKEQKIVVEEFLSKKAYIKLYNKLTISILPNLTKLIKQCNKKEKKGCKREVNRRLKELISILKNELKTQKNIINEDFDITKKVYDYLVKEVKKDGGQ